MDLFDAPDIDFRTEGIKYAGSKLKLLPRILSLIAEVRPGRVFDAFSGSTRVAQAMAKAGYEVTASDISVWSEVFGKCYLKSTRPAASYRSLIDHLNAVLPIDGWFTENYGGYVGDGGKSVGPDGTKKPWQRHNTRKLDAIRLEIDRLGLDEESRCVALTSLIRALDSVDNTLGHYVSYLSDWSPRSYREMVLTVPMLVPIEADHAIVRGDALDLVPKIDSDLAYFDPPYGSNNEKMPPSRVRYASYYHVWTSVCLNDRPGLFGKVGRRLDTSDTVATSAFEEFRKGPSGRYLAIESIDQLIRTTRAGHVLLSYSSGGRATAEELGDLLASHGKVKRVVEIDYKRNVMADLRWTNDWIRDAETPNREFLFLLEK